jgi:adenine deaminase
MPQVASARITNVQPWKKCLYLICSDDLQPRTILEQGHIDNDLRLCAAAGLDPMTAIRMATLNAAECYGLKDRGGFAPGLHADIALVNNLREFRVSKMFIGGKLAAEDRRYVADTPPHYDDSSVRNSFNVKDFSAHRLAMPLRSNAVWVIDLKPGGVVTGKGRALVYRDAGGNFTFNGSNGIAKIAVVERHKGTGNVGLGLIRGYGIRSGAVGISVAHDSHNIIVVGTSDGDIAAAVNRIIALGGGAVLVKDGAIPEEMPLPIGGIMSDQNGEWVRRKLTLLQETAFNELGINREIEPLMSLCFMSLPVIPELKITDMGLFDFAAFGFIPVEAGAM